MAIALIDIIRPYFFAGFDLGPGVQDALSVLHVDELDTAWDDDAVVMTGIARIDSDNPSSPFFSPQAGGGALNGSPPGSTGGPLKWEWHDVGVRFRLTLARRAAESLPVGQVTATGVSTVLNALGPTTGTGRSDYPNTQFRLEIMFELVTVTFPQLIGARLDGFVLVPDLANREVKISLPRVLLILTQDSGADTDFDVKLGSFGAETLDDQDPGIASLLKMNPPFALVPGEQFGFGFRKAVLDLSDERTPPDLLDQFGVGDDWQGIFLPEVRFFASTQRSAGVAFNIGARELLIGLDPMPGLWGEFNIDVDVLGERLSVGIRLYGVSGARFDPELVVTDEGAKADRYRVTVPSTSGPDTENYVLFVDINSGAAPFVITAVSGEDHPENLEEIPNDAFFDDPDNDPQDITVPQRMRLFSQDQRVAIRITSRNPAQRRIIVLDVFPDLQTSTSTQPPKPEVPQAKFKDIEPADAGTVVIASQTENEVVLRLTPSDGALMVNGTVIPVTDGQARVPVPVNSSHEVIVTWQRAGEEQLERFSIFFEYDHPKEGVIGTTTSSGDLDALVQAFQNLPEPERILRVDAYASREAGTAQTTHNNQLSARRAAHLVSLLTSRGIPENEIDMGQWGNQSHPSSDTNIDQELINGQVPNNHSAEAEWENGQNPNYRPERFRVAHTNLLRPTLDTDTFTGTLFRDPIEQPATHNDRPEEPPAPQSEQPGWLRHIGGTVRFERDAIPVAGELRLTVDFKTAHEEGLEEFREDIDNIGPSLEDPEEQARLPQGNPNPEDGVVEFRLAITYDPSTETFTETLVARAAAADRDGLWSWGSIPAADAAGEPVSDGWRDVLGLYFALAPLLAESAPEEAGGGDIVPLVVGLAAPVTITILGAAHVLRFTHYGVELTVRHDEDEVHAALLFDVESAIWLNFKIDDFVIATNRPDKPIKIRYKAVGFTFDAPPDQPVRFLPVFDSSRGFTVDLADSGSLKILPSLGGTFGDIIQVLGARIARTNPLNLEVELGFGVDLGVITVDRFGFRQPLDPIGPPSITAIGVGVDIPGVLEGKGYLKIEESGFAGQLDLTLPSVQMRVAGGLSIRTVTEGERSATATLVTIAVELPTGILLGGTGLAVFGFLGLFAVHHVRAENPATRNPALDWLVNAVAGDPTDIRGWVPALDKWAFGVGLVAGTIEGGTVFNLKGMLVLELPGPRVLIFAKAKILSEKPDTRGTDTGVLFAVVDVNPQRVLIGIQFEYHIETVLNLMIPIEAGFFYHPPAFPPEHFYVDAGTIARPATAKVLQLFDATAYFMVHGDGIPDFPLGALQGFSVAAGFRSSFIWGNVQVRLYLKITAGFDVGIGFKPLLFTGRVFIDGQLRLFIVTIEAHGELKFRSNGEDTRLEGKICGRVSFFFFSVKGCVGFSIGTDPTVPPVPDPIRDLMLQSRSPALIEGTGVDRGLDNVLCHGTADGSIPKVEVREGDDVVLREMFVPIDSIPLIQFEVAPQVAAGATIDGVLSSGLPPGFGGWQKRGENYLRYTINSIELRLVSIGGNPVPQGTPPVTDGPRPYTWRHPAQLTGSDGLPVELALLDWKPTNVDRALVQGPALDSLVDSRWDSVCTPVAEAAHVLWTFRFEPIGPAPDGWRITGEAWPDAPGTTRSIPVETTLRVREIWRTGTFVDGLLPTIDATVVGLTAPCPKASLRTIHPHTVLSDQARLARIPGLPLLAPLPGGPLRNPRLRERISRSLAAHAASRLCVAKALQAPYEVLAEFQTLPDLGLFEALLKWDDKRKEELRDVIRLTGGPFREITLLVFARTKMVFSDLVRVRAFAPGGVELDVEVSFEHVLNTTQLPPKWLDQSGPWWDDVMLVESFFEHLLRQEAGWGQFLFHVKLPAPALRIDIGVSPLAEAVHNFGMTPPSYYLAVVQGLSEQEVLREESDSNESQDDAHGLEDGLSNNPRALLIPNARYEVVVNYDGDIGRKRDDPEEDEDPNEIVAQRSVTNQTVRRTFFTDREPPRNLDPWMLAQFPSPGEPFHFYDDPVVVVFATDDVLQLYKAYNKSLRAVARAASFRGSEGTPEALSHRFDLDLVFEKIGAAILTPWEAIVRRHFGSLLCGNFDPDNDQHGRVTLPFDLDPLTDYVLDLEMLNPNGTVSPIPPLPGEVGQRPLYRQGFTTSRYATREAFAEEVRTALVVPRLVNNSAPLLALTDRVADEVFDLALLDSGLGTAARPESSRVSVLWDNSTPAQPLAIYLETPEPLWRTRREPEARYDTSGQYILSWTMADHLWLFIDELVRENEDVLVADGGEFVQRGTGTKVRTALTIKEFRIRFIGPRQVPSLPIPPPPATLVDRFIRDAGGTRTLVVLKPGVHGKTVSLGLTRDLHPLLDIDTTDTPVVLCEVDLVSPPWEELL